MKDCIKDKLEQAIVGYFNHCYGNFDEDAIYLRNWLSDFARDGTRIGDITIVYIIHRDFRTAIKTKIEQNQIDIVYLAAIKQNLKTIYLYEEEAVCDCLNVYVDAVAEYMGKSKPTHISPTPKKVGKATDEQLKRLQDEKGAIEKDYDKVKKEKEKLSDKRDELSRENQSLKSKIANLRHEKQQLANEKDQLKKENDLLNDKANKLRRDVSDLTRENNQLTDYMPIGGAVTLIVTAILAALSMFAVIFMRTFYDPFELAARQELMLALRCLVAVYGLSFIVFCVVAIMGDGRRFCVNYGIAIVVSLLCSAAIVICLTLSYFAGFEITLLALIIPIAVAVAVAIAIHIIAALRGRRNIIYTGVILTLVCMSMVYVPAECFGVTSAEMFAAYDGYESGFVWQDYGYTGAKVSIVYYGKDSSVEYPSEVNYRTVREILPPMLTEDDEYIVRDALGLRYGFEVDPGAVKTITIPDSVNRIGEGVAKGCENVEAIALPFLGENREDMDQGIAYLFGVRNGGGVPKSLKRVVLTDAERIPDNAFDACQWLEEVEIPRGVEIIGEDAFRNCVNLSNIVYRGTSAEWDDIIKETGWASLTNRFVVRCSDNCSITYTNGRETYRRRIINL